MVKAISGNQIIYLCGFMGSGKSTLGGILANSIGFSFYDLDIEIEKLENCSIKNIFKYHGEEYFRRIETKTLLEISENKNIVISLGGGTILNPINMEHIKKTGILVYLKVDNDILSYRLRNKTDRPLLLDNDGKQLPRPILQERITFLIHEREKAYEQATLKIEIKKERIGKTVDNIVKILHSNFKLDG